MITTHLQVANAKDLTALTSGHGSPWRNIIGVTIPAAIASGLVLFALTRSDWLSPCNSDHPAVGISR